jgi:nitrogen fixation NifU-like protein
VNRDDLYQEELLRLARERCGAGRLEAPAGVATLDSPLCGDRITVEVRLAGGKVEALAHRVLGCVLCQAAASLLGRGAAGRTPAEVELTRGALEALLGQGTPIAGEPLDGFSVFAPVRAVPSRHACVLLPFDALRAAIAGAGG